MTRATRLSPLLAPVSALLLAAVPCAHAMVAPTPGARATIAAVVKVGRPETRQSRARLRARHETPAPLRARASLTVVAKATGAFVLHESVTTNTTFVLSLAPGVYRISAQIGPPLVNPSPRSCGQPRVVAARAHRRAVVAFSCTLG